MNALFPHGLDADSIPARQAREGFNELAIDQRRTLPRIIAEVVREPMFLLLLGAGAIYLAMGDAHEALILLGFVVIIMTITILQERRTEKALEALRDLSSPRALVIRDGLPVRIPGRDVVPEDILILTEGDRVPADGTVRQSHELATDESLLTGESLAVAKFAAEDATRDDKSPLPAEQTRVYAGTLVVRGQGIVEVTAIGAKTELGQIGKSLHSIETETSPLQIEMARLTRRLSLIGVGLCLLLTVLYVALRGEWLQGILAGITLAMGILPQEFPVIMIVFLALGARRIAQQQVLTRRLDAIETLGETTTLCVDKTGTLTQNRMSIAALCVGKNSLRIDPSRPLTDLPESYHELLEFAVLASEITPHDPMEQAFHRFARDYLANTEHLHADWDLAREYELSAQLPAMSHLWKPTSGGAHVVASKGAPEAIADLCHLDARQAADLATQAEIMANEGLRILGIAKAIHHQSPWPDHQHDFAFELVGLVGLTDPLRPAVPAAVRECQAAGIRVVMITGDHPHTARAIAAQAGIPHERVLTGADLAQLPVSAGDLTGVQVFARVAPHQKLAIVEAFKAKGEVVAMTGDGVNDAPALKAAHIGIAMGKRGTDVAREAASLVLLEDDFVTIVAAIRLGRRIFANLRDALIYTLAVHIPIIGLSILPVLLGMPLLLAPIHIAFLELVIDPACSLVFEAKEEDVKTMEQAPRSPKEPLIARRHLLLALAKGLLTTAMVACLYYLALAHGVESSTARAMAFITLVTANAILILVNRMPAQASALPPSASRPAGLPAVVFWTLGGTFAGLLCVTQIPALAQAFEFTPPAAGSTLIALGAGLLLLPLFNMAQRMAPLTTK